MAQDDKGKFVGLDFMLRNVRLQWANRLFTPDTQGKYADGKYSVYALIDKQDEAQVAEIRKAVAQAATKGIEAGLLDKERTIDYIRRAINGDMDEDFFFPLTDGDKSPRLDKEPELAGHWVIKASSKNKPRVYDGMARLFDDDDKAHRDVYSGCYANVRIFFNVFEPNKALRGGGVAVWLNAVQKVRDGERIGGSYPANDGFEPVPGAQDAADGFAPVTPGSDAGATGDMYSQMGL